MPQVMTTLSSFRIPSLLFLISHLLSIPSPIAADDPLYISCLSSENYTSASRYATNLQLLLANLISTTPRTENLFFQYTAGAVENQTAFGLAQCRPDKSAAICADCLIRAAALAVNDTCRGKKSVSVRNEYCVLRYVDQNIPSENENTDYNNLYRQEVAANPADYGQQVGELLEEVMLEAKNNRLRIAAGEKTNDMNGNIYGLAWCTIDLTPDDCYKCLSEGLKSYSGDNGLYMLGGGSMTVSCIVTYNNYVFFGLSLMHDDLSPTPAPGGTGHFGAVIVLLNSPKGVGELKGALRHSFMDVAASYS